MKKLLLPLLLAMSLMAQELSTNAPSVVTPSPETAPTAPPPETPPTPVPAVDATPAPSITPTNPPPSTAPAIEEAPQPVQKPAPKKPEPRTWQISENEPHFVGHRYYEKKAGGWGWIKKPDESWKNARWAALKETPREFHAPHRSMGSVDADHHHEYRLLGYFADYKVYDPTRDEMLDVFVIQGYQSLGEQPEIGRKPGPSDRFRARKSGAFSRGASIPSPDSDSF